MTDFNGINLIRYFLPRISPSSNSNPEGTECRLLNGRSKGEEQGEYVEKKQADVVEIAGSPPWIVLPVHKYIIQETDSLPWSYLFQRQRMPFAATYGHMTKFCAVDVGEHDMLLATLAHINLHKISHVLSSPLSVEC